MDFFSATLLVQPYPILPKVAPESLENLKGSAGGRKAAMRGRTPNVSCTLREQKCLPLVQEAL